MSKKDISALALVVIVAALVLTSVSSGMQTKAGADPQNVGWDKETRTISVTGMSSTKVLPDRVTVSFAIETQAKTAEQASKFNANITTSVIKALTDAEVSESEIGTSYYNVYPVYEYVPTPIECTEYGTGDQAQKYCPTPAQKQILAGYKAVNSVSIESAKHDMVGQWIDAAVAAGANRVEYLYFSLSSQGQDEIRNDLVAQAVQDARNRAEIAIKSLGMNITDVLSISLDSYPVIYPKRGYESAAGAPSMTTPIIPGTQEVSVSVHAMFEIGGFTEGRDFMNDTVYATSNGDFKISLNSNPSTGYRWQVKTIDETITKLVNNQYVAPESDLAGASGKHVLTFEALKEGKTTITLEYVRPWDPKNPASIYSVEVIVSPTS